MFLAKTRLLITLIILLVSTFFFKISAQDEITCEELIDLLGIRKYKVPMPIDKKYIWSLAIIDYQEINDSVLYSSDWIDSSDFAQIYFMPIEKKNTFRYWFKQAGSKSEGLIRIDVCDNPDDIDLSCEYGQFSKHWYKVPILLNREQSFLICDIQETFDQKRKKQLILKQVRYKL